MAASPTHERPTPFQAKRTGPTTLELVGELDLATVSMLREALREMPASEQVTFDLAQLEFIDSSGLSEIATYATSLGADGPLILENVTDRVASLLTIVGFDRFDSIQVS